MMLSIAWIVTAVLLFIIGIGSFREGGLLGMFLGIILVAIAALCLVGFNWSLRGFRPDHTIMPDGEKIDHGK